MTEMGSIFNPGEAELSKQLAAEKTLPAPSPVPSPPLTDRDGDELMIPGLDDLPEPRAAGRGADDY